MTSDWFWTLNKSALYTLHTYPRGPGFRPFWSTPSRFRDASCRKSEMNQMTSDWPWTLSQVPYMHWYFDRNPNFTSFSSTTELFCDNCRFFFFGFLICYNGAREIPRQKNIKSRRLKISNIRPVCFCEDHREDNSGGVWNNSTAIWIRSNVFNFVPVLYKYEYSIVLSMHIYYLSAGLDSCFSINHSRLSLWL